MKKKLIFYDLDGTLADTRDDICFSINFMIQQMGGAPKGHAEIASYVGQGLHHLVKNCLGTEDLKKVERGSEIYKRHYGIHMMDHTELYPDTLEILNYFKGRFQAVITNKPDPFTSRMLKELGIDGYFFKVVPGNGRYPKKPDPAAILALIREKKVKAVECLMIGDSEIDIQTAQNAGIEAAVISHGFVPEDRLKSLNPAYLGKSFKDLLVHVRKKKW